MEVAMFELSSLPLLVKGRSRSINQENYTGEKGKGGMASSDLGPGRKGSPCIRKVEPGSTITLGEIQGPGVIQHIWITVTDRTSERNRYVTRDLPIAVNPQRGFNCYFPMPFRKSAKITIENQNDEIVPGFFYQIDYCEYDELPENTAYFHAQWRRQRLTEKAKDYVILDNVHGSGKYVGTYLALTTLERYWYGEGEVKIYLDGDEEYPTICGTGTEDYFGGAWSFAHQEDGRTVEQTFCTPFLGYPYYSNRDTAIHNNYHNDDMMPQRSFYRWHIMDPILFEKDIKVTIQQIGVYHGGLFERQDDVASVAYWYQTEPHTGFQPLPERKERWPR